MDLQPIPVNGGGAPVFPPAPGAPRPGQKQQGTFYTPVAVNGLPMRIQGIRELKPGMTIDQATDVLTAKKDGLDTILFTVKDQSGAEKGYLAYGDNFDFQGLKRPDGMLYFNGQPTSVKFMKRELNTPQRGAREGALTAAKSMTDTVIDTSKGIIAGVKPATAIVFGMGALVAAGIAIKGAVAGTAVVGGVAAAGAVAAGSTFGGMVSALSSTVFPALLVLAGAAVVGTLFVAGIGAVGGALDAMRNKNNAEYTQISKASQ